VAEQPEEIGERPPTPLWLRIGQQGSSGMVNKVSSGMVNMVRLLDAVGEP
jgi:hypothetical protein